MTDGADIWFFATSKSGLGHLRRTATIAAAIRASAPERTLRLVSNAAIGGLEPDDLSAFSEILIAPRADMATLLPTGQPVIAVLDTITIPDIELSGARLVLILRETPEAELARFVLPEGRAWDHVIVANPAAHWLPSLPSGRVKVTSAVGWIYRQTEMPPAVRRTPPQLLVATGGGGTAETAATLYALIDEVIAAARAKGARLHVVQAVGPRARSFGQLEQADRLIDPGGRLNEHFSTADLAISTAGYNSVLELATTDTPTLLVPIPRSIDDQGARVRLWGPMLGIGYSEDNPQLAVDWLVRAAAAGSRRAPVDLGPSGEHLAAEHILALQ